MQLNETRAGGAPSVATLIRFHEQGNKWLLKRALASLAGQRDVNVCPIVLCDHLSGESYRAVQGLLSEFGALGVFRDVVVRNREQGPGDHRSALLNLGTEIAYAQLECDYLAVLDYDDVLYGHAYVTLANALARSGAAIAFATVEVADSLSFAKFDFIYNLARRYRGTSKIDLIKDNFCPIHSYMFDLKSVPRSVLHYDEQLTILEDYDLLLRIAAEYPLDFSEIGTTIGLYYWRNNGSDSTVLDPLSGYSAEKWKEAQLEINKRKARLKVDLFASDIAFLGG
jgi:hypothetical protein